MHHGQMVFDGTTGNHLVSSIYLFYSAGGFSFFLGGCSPRFTQVSSSRMKFSFPPARKDLRPGTFHRQVDIPSAVMNLLHGAHPAFAQMFDDFILVEDDIAEVPSLLIHSFSPGAL